MIVLRFAWNGNTAMMSAGLLTLGSAKILPSYNANCVFQGIKSSKTVRVMCLFWQKKKKAHTKYCQSFDAPRSPTRVLPSRLTGR